MAMGGREVTGGAARTAVLALLSLVAGVALGVALHARALPALSTLMRGGPGEPLVGRTTVAEDELDRALGAYTIDGERVEVSVRETIQEGSSLAAMRNDDGTYELPSADEVLAVARNAILSAEAASRGLAATDDDALAFAELTLGTRDLSLIAANYNMEAEQAREHLRQAALLKKLHDEVVTVEDVAEPAEPAPPETGAEDAPSADYARYVIGLAGAEWDAAGNTWASEDGPYRAALRDYTVSNEAATYSAARAAYEVASSEYAAAQRRGAAEWTAFVNDLLCQATVELESLVA